MGFTFDSGIGGYGFLFAFLLAVPVVIFLIWMFQLNRQVREELHDEIEDEGGDPPIA